jgi:ankyrin repeat protein
MSRYNGFEIHTAKVDVVYSLFGTNSEECYNGLQGTIDYLNEQSKLHGIDFVKEMCRSNVCIDENSTIIGFLADSPLSDTESVQLARFLVDTFEANTTKCNKDNKSPYDLAVAKGKKKLADYLLSRQHATVH